MNNLCSLRIGSIFICTHYFNCIAKINCYMLHHVRCYEVCHRWIIKHQDAFLFHILNYDRFLNNLVKFSKLEIILSSHT